jgi:DNA-binding NtrC family response regulator
VTSDDALAKLLVGDSQPMRELRAIIRRIAPTSLPVLIRGPRGTGKELVAHALHAASGRTGAFVAFNVCAIADSMFEDAMFGHVRGSFSGAVADSPGYLAEANRGTVLFDEVSGVSLANQRKLLRVIETRQFRPVGGRADRASDFRVVAATNDDLDGLIARGEFRADLADRLSVCTIHVPSLAERLGDIPQLVDHFVRTGHNLSSGAVSNAAVDVLMVHDWPGNVRQLRHTIERALVLAEGRVLGAEDMARVLGTPTRQSPGASFQRHRLVEVLDRVDWNVASAARALGVARATIYRRLRRHGLYPPLTNDASTPGVRESSDREAL